MILWIGTVDMPYIVAVDENTTGRGLKFMISLQQRGGAADVVVVVQQWIGDELADVSERGKVHACRRAVTLQHLAKTLRVGNIATSSGPHCTASRLPRDKLS